MLYTKLGRTEEKIPVIGQGTFKYGEDVNEAKEEIEALRFGIENGLTLIDTAEGYGNGGSERIVAEAIKDCRNDVFISTKVLARNCSYQGVIDAAEASLERLKTSYIDLYFQHWPSMEHEVEETMRGMAYLVDKGLVKYIGVSNYTPELMETAWKALGKHALTCNQVGYHLNDRRIENNVLPYCQERGITVMGYSPFGYAPELFGNQGFPKSGSNERQALDEIGAKYDKTAYQVALNWILRQKGLVSIPKAKNKSHIKSNLEALGWELDAEDLAQMNVLFPKPVEDMPLLKY
ncbi:aldo/keto reductase [Neobacillus sp. PS3-34]|uniref:aldo/keto reductase n=1 Tax=Neobacillus sp. PS3-34 TaxID=3070678 RepID=UPI0027E08C58|nr:aldo/keto reductase [Neobacillus sp. PS3-34]WML48698.1 aldo/keto reductase [Neobacillus sp. PS3-34]